MISVITKENTISNPYPGMSLAEACNQLMLETVEAVNEFQMDILLTEHAYLYANGSEMVYVEEATGEDNEAGKTLKEKALALIEKIGKKIGEIWDKLVEWVDERVDTVVAAFKKASITKGHFEKAAKYWIELKKNETPVENCCKVVVDFEKFMNEYSNLYDFQDSVEAPNAADVYAKYVKANDAAEKFYITEDLIKEAVEALFTKNNILKNIANCKKAANRYLDGLKRDIKKAKGDDMAEKINKLNAAMKNNTKIAQESVKVYHAYVNNQVNIAKAVMADKDVKKAIFEQAKQDIKEAPGKTVDAAKKGAQNAGKAIESGAKKAGEAVKGAGEKVAEKAKSVFGKGKKEAAAEEVKQESAVYDGKYFRV